MLRKLLKFALLGIASFVSYRLFLAIKMLLGKDVRVTLAQHTNQGQPGITLDETTDHEHYSRQHLIEDGIERIIYRPKERRYNTPIVMQHGMWHGAWTWDTWGPLFAEWGWEVHTHSLPGHTGSPAQTPIEACTLDYYLGFLKAEINRHAVKPILLGHSMGGALAQWYFKYVGDLSAAILVAPWPHELVFTGETLYMTAADPIGMLLSIISQHAEQCRNPQAAAHALLSPTSILSPQDLYAKLGPESVMVMMQHHPPFWFAPKVVNTPILLLAGEADAVVSVSSLRQTADYYHADYREYPGAAHNLMMEANYADIARHIHDWLVKIGIK